MKDMKRSIRRAHIKRLKEKRKSYWGYGVPYDQVKHSVFLGIGKGWVNELHIQRGLRYPMGEQLSRLVQNPQNCSCLGCSGNFERRYFGRRTLKEILSIVKLSEELKEL